MVVFLVRVLQFRQEPLGAEVPLPVDIVWLQVCLAGFSSERSRFIAGQADCFGNRLPGKRADGVDVDNVMSVLLVVSCIFLLELLQCFWQKPITLPR